MTERRMTVQGLHEVTGISHSYLIDLRKGRAIPRLAVSALIAEALESEGLHQHILDLRRRVCPVCDRRFVSDHRALNRQTFCSVTCASTARQRDKIYRATERRRGLAQLRAYRLEMYQGAVDAHCHSCEPSGLCRTETCALRSVSPLPLAEERLRVA